MEREARFELVTTGVIVATIVALVAYDIFTVDYAGANTSISRTILIFLSAHPAVALAAGALLGHLTWPSPTPPNRKLELVLLIASLLILVAMDVLHVLPAMLPVWPFLIGVPVGRALWGQCITPAQRMARSISW